MLRLYRRHRTSCPHTSELYRRCKCPIYVEGSLRGERIKKSLDLTSWEAAADLVNAWSAAGEIGIVKPEVPTISEAVTKYLKDAEARHLSTETVRKYRNLLELRLVAWCEKEGFQLLKQLDVDALRRFRESWDDGPVYALKNLEKLRAFFRFCLPAGWIKSNPALALKSPKATVAPTLPFTEEEMKRILEACDKYPGNKTRMKAFVLAMRWSGLRIGDCLNLTRDRVKDGKIFLYTQKTGTPVYVPLPKEAADALDALPGARFFTTGNATHRTIVANWHRYLQTVFELAKVDGAHSHRFRDTFAVSLLEKGVSIETVSVLLGHSDIRITLRHYRPWVKSLQTRLETEVQKAWLQSQP